MKHVIIFGLLFFSLTFSCEKSNEDFGINNCSEDFDALVDLYLKETNILFSYSGDINRYCSYFKNTWSPIYFKYLDCIINSSRFTPQEKKLLRESLEESYTSIKQLTC